MRRGRRRRSLGPSQLQRPVQFRSDGPRVRRRIIRRHDTSIARVVVTSVVVLGFASLAHAQAPDGAELYKRTCAQCHDTGANRAPDSRRISIDAGRARAGGDGNRLDDHDGQQPHRRRAASHRRVPHRQVALESRSCTTPAPAARCVPRDPPAFDSTTGPRWTGWGQNTNNTRFQDAGAAGLTAADMPEAETQMGVRVPRRSAVLLAGHASPADASSSAAGAARCTRSTPRPDASTGSSTPDRACARLYRSCEWTCLAAPVTSPSSAMRLPMSTHWTRRPASSCGRPTWTTSPSDASAARRRYYNGRIYVGVASGEEATGRSAHLRVLQVPRQRRRARCGNRQTDLEDLHDRGATEADEEERRRHAALGPIGRSGVGDAGCRRQAESPLRHHRQQLQRPDVDDERFVPRDGSRHGQDPLVKADDREGRLHRRVPSARQDQLRRVERSRLRLRRLADPRHARRAAGACSSPARSPASCTRSIRTRTARCCGRRASAAAGRWAACSGDRRRISPTSTWRCRTSAASC